MGDLWQYAVITDFITLWHLLLYHRLVQYSRLEDIKWRACVVSKHFHGSVTMTTRSTFCFQTKRPRWNSDLWNHCRLLLWRVPAGVESSVPRRPVDIPFQSSDEYLRKSRFRKAFRRVKNGYERFHPSAIPVLQLTTYNSWPDVIKTGQRVRRKDEN